MSYGSPASPIPRPRRRRLSGGLVLSLFLSGWLPEARAGRADRPPNFLVIVADDLGWRDVGYHGSEVRTPTLDRLAHGGVRLERHYVYPTCSPTRAGLLTGRNPSRFGIRGPIDGRSRDALPADVPNLARVLKARGYDTALVGKWHLGLRPEVGPRRYGFDRSYGYLHGQLDQYTHRYKNGDRTWHRDDAFVDEEGHATDLITAEAVRFLAAERRGQFFLVVGFSVPHHPVQGEAEWVEPYRSATPDPSRRLFAASVTHMDAAVGRVVEALGRSGRLRDTLILFTSDNGGQRDYRSQTEYGGRHGPYPTLGDNRPLRGWKGELYEGGVRVPAFVSWPGTYGPAAVDRVTGYLDVLPTFARLAGADLEPNWRLEGRDIGLLLAGGPPPPASTLFWDTGTQAAVLRGDWKLIGSKPGPGAVELYNLENDPAEGHDLAGQEPDRVRALRQILDEQERLDRHTLRRPPPGQGEAARREAGVS
jgi:arylsulfatase A-like enzyme